MDRIDQSWPKYYTDVAQQKCGNNKYYVSAFKYYIDIDIDKLLVKMNPKHKLELSLPQYGDNVVQW